MVGVVGIIIIKINYSRHLVSAATPTLFAYNSSFDLVWRGLTHAEERRVRTGPDPPFFRVGQATPD